MTMRRGLLCILPLAIACGGGEAKDAEDAAEGGPQAAGAATASTGPTGSASIAGTIKFAGTAPGNPTIDMSEEAECAKKYGGTPVDSQYVVSGGRLRHAFVYVHDGLAVG